MGKGRSRLSVPGTEAGSTKKGIGGAMETAPQKVLFNYLKAIITEDKADPIDISTLPEDFRELGEGLQLLARWMGEMKEMSTQLSDGCLDIEIPDSDNVLVDSLKSLQATMKHIAWQAKQISKGDYSQKIDFMGEFSEAFNDMAKQLQEKQGYLEQSRDEAIKSMELFKRVTDNIAHHMVMILSVETGELYRNKAVDRISESNPALIRKLKDRIQNQLSETDGTLKNWETEITIQDDQSGLSTKWYFLVDVNAVQWEEQPAIAFIIEDITEERRKELEMEGLAFFDALTGLHNRHYIMQVLDKWVEAKEQFCLTFIDLDNLKYANDAFGHEEGDRYIKQAAGTLSDVEGEKELARIGGDEFLLLVRNCKKNQLEHKLEEKRYNLLHRGRGESVSYRKSFSYGIVDTAEFSSANKSMMLREADKLMYEYKMLNKPKIKLD